MGSGNSVPYCSQIFWRISFRITSSDTVSLCLIQCLQLPLHSYPQGIYCSAQNCRPLPIHSVPPSYLDLPWKISLQISSEIKRIVIHVGLQRLYCFFCPYTHFHFKCRPQMLICINFNRPVMNPHNFSHHRKSKPYTSKFPAS